MQPLFLIIPNMALILFKIVIFITLNWLILVQDIFVVKMILLAVHFTITFGFCFD